MTPSPLPVSYDDIEAAAHRLKGHAHRTPVMTCTAFDEAVGAQVFFKCENFQRTGAFKFRGAYNALAQLSLEDRQRGVVTYSSGNHAQAIALAGRELGIATTIIMPTDAPQVKQRATRAYGAEVILYDRATASREALGQQMMEERGMVLIPPFDHPHVVAGQGTATQELIDEVGELDLLLVCCGGGGLLSGGAIATHHLSPRCRVVGVEPEGAADAYQSFHSKTLHRIEHPNTIADGVRTPALGAIPFQIILRHVHDLVTVPDGAILDALFFIWERMKIVVEPTGALAASALLSGAVQCPHGRVGVLISGGNVDVQAMGQLRPPSPQ